MLRSIKFLLIKWIFTVLELWKQKIIYTPRVPGKIPVWLRNILRSTALAPPWQCGDIQKKSILTKSIIEQKIHMGNSTENRGKPFVNANLFSMFYLLVPLKRNFSNEIFCNISPLLLSLAKMDNQTTATKNLCFEFLWISGLFSTIHQKFPDKINFSSNFYSQQISLIEIFDDFKVFHNIDWCGPTNFRWVYIYALWISRKTVDGKFKINILQENQNFAKKRWKFNENKSVVN